MQQETRAIQHATGELHQISSVQHVAHLVADVPAREISGFRFCETQAPQPGPRQAAQSGAQIMGWDVAAAEGVQAGVCAVTVELHPPALGTFFHFADAQVSLGPRFDHFPLAQNPAKQFGSLDDPQLNM